MKSVGRELGDRVRGIRTGISLASGLISSEVAHRAHHDLDQVVQKLELGVDHAVAALVGGTGSGKSSMFNAISRQEIADVGVIRPTTALATACSWSTHADPLLDFLQVPQVRRSTRVPPLVPPDEDRLAGLVLLDLPDHDSIEVSHAEQVNRLLPMIDLLIWVLDPQKYADNALHERYLRALTQRHEAMLVVVNQIDTIPESGLEQIEADVRRLLEEDQLADVPIVLASAKTGHGVGMVRDHLGEVMANESTAARTARSEIDAVAERVRRELAPVTPALPDTDVYANRLATISGIDAMAESISHAVSSTGSVALATVQPAAPSRVAAVQEDWLDEVTTGMPAPWRHHVIEGVSSLSDFQQATTDAAAGVRLPKARDEQAARLRVGGFALLSLGLVLAVLALLIDPTLVFVVAAGASVAAGVALLQLARSRRQRSARSRSTEYRQAARKALGAAIDEHLRDHAAEPISRHERVLSLVAGINTVKESQVQHSSAAVDQDQATRQEESFAEGVEPESR